MLDQETIIAPAVEADNVIPPVLEDNEEQTSPVAVPADNDVIAPEKREELSRKLHGSREEALRLKAEAERLAAENADLKARVQFQSQPEETPFSDQDVAVFKALAAKAGLAPREEVQAIRQERIQEQQQQHLNSFLSSHPEYNRPQNPQSDQLWQKLQSELALYRSPQTPEELKTFLERAHRSINNGGNDVERGKALGYAQANLQEQNRVGSASSGGSSSPKNSKLSPDRQAIREGFASARPEYYSK
jgi:hypothetical protein